MRPFTVWHSRANLPGEGGDCGPRRLAHAVFGLIAVATAYVVTWRLAKAIEGGGRASLRAPAAIEGQGAKAP